MKKRIFFGIAALIIALSFIGCTDGGGDDDPPPTTMGKN